LRKKKTIANFYFHPEVDSTNKSARTLFSNKEAKEGSIIYSFHQKNGKGRGENKWYSSENQSICLSLIIEPEKLSFSSFFKLHMMSSIAIVEALEKHIHSESLKIKWPNDIYYKDKKLAGILITNDIAGKYIKLSIIGVGINVNQCDFPNDIPNPISLKQITGIEHNIKSLLHDISHSLLENYDTLNSNIDFFNTKYHKRLYKLDVLSKYYINNKVQEGIIKGIDEEGKLKLEQNKNIHAFDMDEIKFLLK
jgi:BirA family transcriptional regulator, biotin operon repressor / biotin---[acetyl-CoA-carboxylase] ligase